MFGGFQQPQPQQFPQQVPPQQYNNPVDPNASLNQLYINIDGANQLSKDPIMQNLIILLGIMQQNSIQCIQKASSPNLSKSPMDDPKKKDQAVQMSQKCRIIKQKNHQNMIKLLNLRSKMMNQMYMHKIRSPKTEIELDQINELIRHRKMQVNNKMTQLKFVKMSNQNNKVQSPVNFFAPLTKPLTELKNGAELLQKQALKSREQLNLLIKFLRGGQI